MEKILNSSDFLSSSTVRTQLLQVVSSSVPSLSFLGGHLFFVHQETPPLDGPGWTGSMGAFALWFLLGSASRR